VTTAAPKQPRSRSTAASRQRKAAFDARAALKWILSEGSEVDALDVLEWEGNTVSDAAEPSPIEASRLLAALFARDEMVYCGPVWGGQNCIRSAGEWADVFQQQETSRSRPVPSRTPFFIVNPLTGRPAPKRDGSGVTYTGSACVSAHRHTVAEADDLAKPDQLRFWSWFYTKAPDLLVALIDSGNRSYHAILRTHARDESEWRETVEQGLFSRLLVPLGMDPSTRTPAHKARLPGQIRELCFDGDAPVHTHQWLLFLNERIAPRSFT
jgi:hypothetical protein